MIDRNNLLALFQKYFGIIAAALPPGNAYTLENTTKQQSWIANARPNRNETGYEQHHLNVRYIAVCVSYRDMIFILTPFFVRFLSSEFLYYFKFAPQKWNESLTLMHNTKILCPYSMFMCFWLQSNGEWHRKSVYIREFEPQMLKCMWNIFLFDQNAETFIWYICLCVPRIHIVHRS